MRDVVKILRCIGNLFSQTPGVGGQNTGMHGHTCRGRGACMMGGIFWGACWQSA